MKIEVKEIQFGSAEYGLEVTLRNRVLREPLGLRLHDDDLAKEGKDIHLGAFNQDQLCGCLMMSPLSSTKVQMRQVAVAPEHQGEGIGKILVKEFERVALAKGFFEVELKARLTAVSFYEKLGYAKYGEQLVEVKIPHYKMRKNLKS